MRKCLRCQSEMKEDLLLMTASGYACDVWEKGVFKDSLGKVKCAICTECGYMGTYLEDPSKLKK